MRKIFLLMVVTLVANVCVAQNVLETDVITHDGLVFETQEKKNISQINSSTDSLILLNKINLHHQKAAKYLDDGWVRGYDKEMRRYYELVDTYKERYVLGYCKPFKEIAKYESRAINLKYASLCTAVGGGALTYLFSTLKTTYDCDNTKVNKNGFLIECDEHKHIDKKTKKGLCIGTGIVTGVVSLSCYIASLINESEAVELKKRITFQNNSVIVTF